MQMHTYLCFGAGFVHSAKRELFATIIQDLDAACGFWLLVIYFITVIRETYNTGQGLSKCMWEMFNLPWLIPQELVEQID